MARAAGGTPKPSEWRDNWRHLRVTFQLTLAPIFLWGSALSGARWGWRLGAGFFAFHFLLYTGITAFNSYYDRDEGPIGGLERPPTIHASLLPLSLALQGAGLAVALAVGRAFTALYLAFVVLSVLYSHPRTRWKANPWLSTAVVCGGQGWLGFLAGWAAARGSLAGAFGEAGALAGLVAALTTLAMYPLTQVYQVEEDARRGDRTLCVVLGERGGLLLSQAAFGAAGAAAVAVAALRLTWLDAAALAAAYAGIAWRVGALRRAYALRDALDTRGAFRVVLRLTYATSAAFLAFIVVRLARW